MNATITEEEVQAVRAAAAKHAEGLAKAPKPSGIWKDVATVVYFESLNCTVNGNPRYEIVFDIEWLWTRKVVTASDYGFVYGLNLKKGKRYSITWRRRGKSWDKFALTDATEIDEA